MIETPATASPRWPGWRAMRRELRALGREARSWPTIVLALCSAVAAISLAIVLTPAQEVVTLGQHIAVKARPPSLSVAGPAQIVQVGNTSLDVPRLRVYGPVRPRLEMGPAVRSEDAVRFVNPKTTEQASSAAARTIGGGFVRWCAWGFLIALGVAAGVAAGASYVRLLRGQSWQRITRMAVISVSTTSMLWVASCGASVAGAAGLREVTSFADLVGQYHLSPTPVGPKLYGYDGVVLGDSRAVRVGGPPLTEPSQDDRDCGRSADSLAAEIELGLPGSVLNLACPSATIRSGLLGPQPRSGRQLAPQVAILKQVQDVDFVVVVIGPNDLWWSDLIAYCYGVRVCNDKFIRGNYDYRLAQFDRDYGQLLRELDDLPTHPQVIVVTSYDVLDPEAGEPAARCRDARGPAGASGLTPEKIRFLSSLNGDLNEVLRAGATKYGFDVAGPRLAKLCRPSADGLGPDLLGIDDPNPFHPTALGVVRIAGAVLRVIEPR